MAVFKRLRRRILNVRLAWATQGDPISEKEDGDDDDELKSVSQKRKISMK
jgi:hypothetical protein